VTAERGAAERATAERGASSVLALLLASGMVIVCAALAVGITVVDVRHRARAAADLAAVGAAQTWVRGGAPCSAAATLAEANGGWLRRCVVQADAVGVTVEVRREVAAGAWWASARQEAWAGPTAGPPPPFATGELRPDR
jgi:secretion/DNA translocation related TadE-like protein